MLALVSGYRAVRLENLSFFLSWAGVYALAGASLFALWYTFGTRVVARAAAATPEGGTVTFTERGPAGANVGRLASVFGWCASIFLVLSLALRSVVTGRPPYSDMWEYLLAFAAGVSLFANIFTLRTRQATLRAFAMPVALAMGLCAQMIFSPTITPLIPALQNNRLLALHVAAMLISYSVLGVAFGAAVMYLVQGDGRRFARLPDGQTLDELSYRAVLVGFPVLALGIALGAYWGDYAWGRYWGWDPKETTALITWLVFAFYLHARALRGWRGSRVAWIIVLGFVCIVFNIFAVNFWIAGLHSYAGPTQ